VNRVLLVRLGALGDIVHAIPVAAALRRAFPSARIDWLVSAKHREILDLVPVIDRRLVVDDRGSATGGRSLVETVRELRRERYDVAIDLQGLLKSAVIARLSHARRVIGFSAKYARESLARFFYTDAHDPGGDGMYADSEKRHVVEINLGLLTPLGLAQQTPEFPLDKPDSAAARAAVEESGGRYVLLNPGAAWPNKRWPAARFGQLASALHERRGLTSVVLWGPGERSFADEVVATASGAALISRQTSIADVVALARGAMVMVSGDTGPTHIAAALETPLVGIYGPTRPERNGPWRADDETVSRAAVCQCHHLRRCQATEWCLLDIGVPEVLSAVERRLTARDARLKVGEPNGV
jgi:lipopolysaccharide heptosyltransferase I